MRSHRAAAIASALAAGLWLAPAAAQVGGAPRAPASPKGGAAANCQELVRHRDEVARHGQAIQAASRKKADAEQLCKLLSVFTTAESKMLKALEERGAACKVSAQVIDQVRTGHDRATQMTRQVCEVAQGQQAGLTVPSDADRCEGLWARLACPMGSREP